MYIYNIFNIHINIYIIYIACIYYILYMYIQPTYIMCIYSIHTSYCVAQQQPKKPGNLPVKKKVTHKIPPVPGA